MSNTDLNLNTVEWGQLPWCKIQKAVWKLQKRIFRAYVNGDVKKGRRLQKTLIKSYYNRLLSVKKVTQDNSGTGLSRCGSKFRTQPLKKMAEVDKVKSLTPNQRLKLAKSLKLDNKSKPIRRVWIPKPGKDEKRPLGIPVMRDRAAQALAKTALEPEWEASFEENSYGFRPGRSAHDAIGAIFNQIGFKSKFVLNADIAKCFDRINHHQLLAKLNTFPTLRKQIRAWLKADICDFEKHDRTPNHQGTLQRGVFSSLLSNIALHGMENRIKQVKGASLIRYADDFVIFHENLEKLKQCQQIINEWLAQFDLEIKPEKTKIVNTLHQTDDREPGFDFLGFNIRQYPVGKYQSGKNTKGEILGFKTIIKPSKESINRHYQKISDFCSKLSNSKQSELIGKLAPIIIGWCNYYKTVVSQETFSKLSYLTYVRLARWAYRRHPNKSKGWINNKYWKTVGQDSWVFGDKENSLIKHSKVAIKRHIKVKGNKSPFDGDTLYWGKRIDLSRIDN
jgi:RNA-directed DNA polymerase